jgi:hypothetical protein
MRWKEFLPAAAGCGFVLLNVLFSAIHFVFYKTKLPLYIRRKQMFSTSKKNHKLIEIEEGHRFFFSASLVFTINF